MEARCYSGSKNRVKYKKLKLGWRDPIAVLFVAAFMTAVILFNDPYFFGLFTGLFV